MAVRPAWTIEIDTIQQKQFSFTWNGGFAICQKQKNIVNLHTSIREKTGGNPLEISSKSTVELGKDYSAFSLKLDEHFLENIFQSAKVYELGGPFIDLLSVMPKEAKKDERHKKSGKLLYFLYEGEKWPLQPKTAFYDYIYMKAVLQCFKREEIEKLFFYDWFTDIEFNPKKSINCQARSVTILTYIMKHHLENTLNAKQDWIAFHKQIVKG